MSPTRSTSLSPIPKQTCRTEFIVDAQMWLFPNGDFSQPNGVAAFLPRVLPSYISVNMLTIR